MEKAAVPSILKSYKVSNVKSEAHGAELRIIAKEQPFAGAIPEEAALEDVFLYYFGEKGGNEYAVL